MNEWTNEQARERADERYSTNDRKSERDSSECGNAACAMRNMENNYFYALGLSSRFTELRALYYIT